MVLDGDLGLKREFTSGPSGWPGRYSACVAGNYQMGRLALKGAIRCETISATVLPPCCEVSKREDGELEGKEANAPHGLERSCMILIYRIPIRLNLVAKKQ